MPELPEVEVLVRHLEPSLRGRTVRAVDVLRPRIVRPDSPAKLDAALRGTVLRTVHRRAKFLVFEFERGTGGSRGGVRVYGHLGMSGRMFLQPSGAARPRHAVVVVDLGGVDWVFEDPRGFGRFTLDPGATGSLGPEPLEDGFTPEVLGRALAGSRQPIKGCLLDQRRVAGVGNIYAAEALHAAGISPRRAAGRLSRAEVARLCEAIRSVLGDAVRFGSSQPLEFGPGGTGDGLFYYGRASGEADSPDERWRVYDREGRPCPRCGGAIRRIVQAARSSYYCPRCQR